MGHQNGCDSKSLMFNDPLSLERGCRVLTVKCLFLSIGKDHEGAIPFNRFNIAIESFENSLSVQ